MGNPAAGLKFVTTSEAATEPKQRDGFTDPRKRNMGVNPKTKEMATEPMIFEKSTDPKMIDSSTQAWKRDEYMQTTSPPQASIQESRKSHRRNSTMSRELTQDYIEQQQRTKSRGSNKRGKLVYLPYII
jgi:hypothetical protein